MNAHERFKEYTGTKCWQAHISEVNLSQDLKEKVCQDGFLPSS